MCGIVHPPVALSPAAGLVVAASDHPFPFAALSCRRSGGAPVATTSAPKRSLKSQGSVVFLAMVKKRPDYARPRT
jgi:hypothetical protein